MTTHIEARDALVKRLRSVSEEGYRFAGEAADELARTCEWTEENHRGTDSFDVYRMWRTQCGGDDYIHGSPIDGGPYCPYCGGRISVKEA